MIIFVLSGIVLVAGVVLLAIGARGRRLDDHPWCRRCRYDLTGAGTPVVCPECGHDLTARAAVRHGRRRKRPWFVAVGAVLLAASIGGVGAALWGPLRGFDWNTVKPVWLLRLDAGSNAPARNDAAQQELFRRLRAATLTEDDVAAIVADALAAQADPAHPWTGRWGRFVEYAWYVGDVDDRVITEYVAHAFDGPIVVSLASRARSSGPLGFEVAMPGVRVADRGCIFDASYWVDGVTIDGQRARERGSTHLRWGLGSPRFKGPYRGTANAFVEPGAYTAEVTVSRAITLVAGLDSRGGRPTIETHLASPTSSSRSQSGTIRGRPPWLGDDVIDERRFSARGPLTVIGPNGTLVRQVDRDDLTEAVRRSVAADLAVVFMGNGQAMIVGTLSVNAPPIDCVVRVFVRAGGDETPVRSDLVVRANETVRVAVGRHVDRLALGEPVEIVLRNDVARAEGIVGIEETWAGEIVVPVTLTETESSRSRRRSRPLDGAPSTRTGATFAVLEGMMLGPDPGESATAVDYTVAVLGMGVRPDLSGIVDEILARQANPATAWRPAWGTLVDAAWRAGLVTADQFDRYVRAAVVAPPPVRARPRGRRGQAVPIVLADPELRGARRASLGLEQRLVAARIDGRDVPIDGFRRHLGLVAAPARPAALRRDEVPYHRPAVHLAGVEPGRHAIEMDFEWYAIPRRVGGGARTTPARTWAEHRRLPPLASWTQTATAEIEVVPADGRAVELRMDDEAHAAARDAIEVFSCSVTFGAPPRRASARLNGWLSIGACAIAVSYDIVVEYGGERYEVNGGGRPVVFCAPGDRTERTSFGVTVAIPDEPLPATATITLIPNPAWAEQRADVATVVGRAIVIETPVSYERR